MRKTRKILATLLTFAMLFSIFVGTSLPVMAAGPIAGSNLFWELNDDTLTITGTGDMPNSWRIGTPSPWYNNNIKEVIISPGVTSIGQCAFVQCGSLESIAIPASVTRIEPSAFNGCTSLTSITIPDSVTSIGAQAFENCSSLESIAIPAGVESIEYDTFRGCSGLTSIAIPASVERIDHAAFSNCSSLTTITFAGTTPPTNIDFGAFSGCNSITKIKVPAGATAAYVNLNTMTGLTSVEIVEVTSDSPSKPDKKEEHAGPAKEEHSHSYSWVTVQEATTEQDGMEEYRCSCGAVAERSVIPASQVFVKGLYGEVKNAPINGTVTFDSGRLYTMSDYIVKKIAERSDVTTVVTFEYNKTAYRMTIPAGADYSALLADEDYFYGYFYFAQLVGATIEEL